MGSCYVAVVMNLKDDVFCNWGTGVLVQFLQQKIQDISTLAD